jgi:hypothetical protein
MKTLRKHHEIDFSMLGTDDLVNLALQRSSSLEDILPRRRAHPDDWRDIYAARLEEARDEVLRRIWDEIRDTYMSVRACFASLQPQNVADIGCGQAFIDLMIHDDVGCNLTLIDIERSDDLYFGFNKTGGAGYASLDRARAFLTSNGVHDDQIVTINPERERAAVLPDVDMACSFISCGFHYPVEVYHSFFATQVQRAILLDIRKGRGNEALLDSYGTSYVVTEARKFARVFVLKS